MKTILSTKNLSLPQKEHLLNARLAVMNVDFISCQNISFETPKQVIENAIFTSQNGVSAVLKKNIKIKNCYCVGQRTKKLLINKKQNVIFCGANAEELGNHIITKNNTKNYYYFCAQQRLNTLPNLLTKHKIKWHEIPVYETIYTPKEYKQEFDGVLFFSPSGVESYFSVNQTPIHSFCIGNTTAKALHKYTQNYTVATKPSVENVIIKAIKHFYSHD